MERSSQSLEPALARLRALRDERSILDTMARYGHSIDLGDDAGWLACFADDAEYDILYGSAEIRRVELGTRHPGGVLHKGKKQLAAFIAGHSRPPEGIHKHLLFEPQVVIDGDAAMSVSSFARIDRYTGGPDVQSFGSYRDRWQRQPDGRWLIQRREVDIHGVRP